MRTRISIAVTALVLLGAGRAHAQFNAPAKPAPGEDFHVELGLMYWKPTPELTLSTSGLSAAGIDHVDFVKEFDIQDERFKELRVTLHPGRKHKINFSNVPVRYNQDATLERTITFRGQTFPVSVAANADIKWDLLRIGYEWDVVSASRGLLGITADLRYNHVQGVITAANVGTASTDQKAPIPAIGFVARAYPHRNFSITAEVGGFKVPESWSERFQGKFVNADFYGTLSFTRFLAVQGGYRSVVANYVVDEDLGDLKLKGVYFGGLVRF
jgi:hypothetical protein